MWSLLSFVELEKGQRFNGNAIHKKAGARRRISKLKRKKVFVYSEPVLRLSGQGVTHTQRRAFVGCVVEYVKDINVLILCNPFCDEDRCLSWIQNERGTELEVVVGHGLSQDTVYFTKNFSLQKEAGAHRIVENTVKNLNVSDFSERTEEVLTVVGSYRVVGDFNLSRDRQRVPLSGSAATHLVRECVTDTGPSK